MPEMLENGEDTDKDELEGAEANDLAMERVPTADGGASNAEGGAQADGETSQAEDADSLAMVPVDGEEGAEAQASPKPPATVCFLHNAVLSNKQNYAKN